MDWQTFAGIEKNKDQRNTLLSTNGRLKHVLFSQQMSRATLAQLFDTATAVRRLNKTDRGGQFLRTTLQDKRVLNLFVQPSTRTVESFMAAAERLGMRARVIQDLSTSSFAKGESVEDAIRTLSSYFDCIVVRHKEDEFPLKTVWTMLNSQREVPVISAGSGASQHVTQSLLDMYTLRHSFGGRGGIDGKKIMIVSDLLRNRAARSLIYLATKYEGIELVMVSPEGMTPEEEFMTYITDKNGLKVQQHHSVEAALQANNGTIDAIYMTRNQVEYGGNGWAEADAHILKYDYKRYLNENTLILHPLPRQEELPTAWDNHPTNLMWRQVRNGMWLRAALFLHVFGEDAHVLKEAQGMGLTAA